MPEAPVNGLPNRFIIREWLGWAGPALGLKSAVLNTLDVLLSFLPPARDHHMVFASNETILTRAQGLSERSLRRHIALLQEAGLLARQDSPNRKRFVRRGVASALRFGLDLTPLFDKLDLLQDLAAQAREEAAERALLAQRIRSACARRLARHAGDELAVETLGLLRRKLSREVLEQLFEQLAADAPEVREDDLAGSNGQNGRHHKSENKDIKIEDKSVRISRECGDAAIQAIVADLPDHTPGTVVEFAEKMQNAVGISTSLFRRAIEAKGFTFVALLLWTIWQRAKTIKHIPAYFAALTCGRLADKTDPDSFIKRQIGNLSADNHRNDRFMAHCIAKASAAI